MTDTIPCNMDPAFLPVHVAFWRREPTHQLIVANLPAFARLVRRQRLAMDLSQRKVSAMAGLHPMGVNNIESMTCVPSEYSAADLMDALGLTRADLLAEIRAMEDEEARDAQAA